MSQVKVLPDKIALAAEVARHLAERLVRAQTDGAEAQIALTGGSMGSAVWAAMLSVPARNDVDWSRVRVWWGDERYLPAGDADRNDTQNDAAGLALLGLDPAKVHRVLGPDASIDAEASATAYESTLRTHGKGEWDVVLLGMGPDGHVASLFPGHPAAEARDTLAVAVHGSPKPPPTRVSLTLECLNRAREVWLVVAGPDKADAVRRAMDGDTELPAARIAAQGSTVWWVDAEAAALLGN